MTATAEIPKDEKAKLKEFMENFWKLIRKYYVPEGPDSKYWDDLFNDMHRIWDASGENQLALKLLVAFVDYEDAEMKKLYPR